MPQDQSSPQREFAWKSDHAFIKISADESGGRYTLVEDNLTTEFHLPLHVHREHTEAFYLVSGEVEFIIGNSKDAESKVIKLVPGDSLFVPPGTPHSATCITPAKMLTLYQPGGLEHLFEAYAAMPEADFADPEKLRAVDLTHDNIVLGK